MNILLLSPRTPETFWSFKHVLRFVSKRAAYPPLGLLTVAALLPKSWNLKLVDLNVREVRDDDLRWADYVMVTAMIVHRESVQEIVARCRALGRPLVAGGPLFTTGHEQFPLIDHFVLGEAEEVMAEVVRDMRAGRLRRVYEAPEKPDVTKSPVPRWDLIDPQHYGSMAVQYSRGCPFNCEFCDIIVMNGRVPRTKTPEQVIEELETLHSIGWKGPVFLVDDNFIGNKKLVKQLLRALVEWRGRTKARLDFFTEASVNLANDAKLMELMVAAGFNKVFLGIETPEPDSLIECSKIQNTKGDLRNTVRTIQQAGMEVMGGFIIGFDNDPPDIFQRQFDFIQSAGVVTAMVGLLTALPKTRLYERLAAEGRLLAASTGNNTEAVLNFVPKLDHDLLVNGYRQLMKVLYEPNAYYQRIRTFLASYRPTGAPGRVSLSDLRAFAISVWLLGVRDKGRLGYWKLLAHTLFHYPRKFARAVTLAIYGHHFRLVAAAL